jgi:hypothetical protein
VVENIHRLVPYTIMRQTLRVGNVATMISGMMKLILAKMSVGALSNWIGWSTGADEGMNLLQTIISQVVGWDIRALKARAAKLEKGKDAPTKEQFEALREYRSRSRQEHEQCRLQSQQQPLSIVALILATSTAPTDLTEDQQATALEYVNIQFAIHDREQIANVLCHHQPDLLTQGVRDCVTAYEPLIRQVHNAVDLSGTLSDFEAFLTDLIKLTKSQHSKTGPKDGPNPSAPSVEEYVDLFRRHIKSSSHKFLHQVAKNGKEVTRWFREYAHAAASQFQVPGGHPSDLAASPAAGSMTATLNSLVSNLADSDRAQVMPELDAHARYLAALQSSSRSRLDAVASHSNASTAYGPGTYLARWQSLLDTTAITPLTTNGQVRYGKDVEVKEASKVYEAMKTTGNGKLGDVENEKRQVGKMEDALRQGQPDAPSVLKTCDLLGEQFRAVLAGMGKAGDADVD